MMMDRNEWEALLDLVSSLVIVSMLQLLRQLIVVDETDMSVDEQ